MKILLLILLFIPFVGFSQQTVLVRLSNGDEPLIGARVVFLDNNNCGLHDQTSTDSNGWFSVSIPLKDSMRLFVCWYRADTTEPWITTDSSASGYARSRIIGYDIFHNKVVHLAFINPTLAEIELNIEPVANIKYMSSQSFTVEQIQHQSSHSAVRTTYDCARSTPGVYVTNPNYKYRHLMPFQNETRQFGYPVNPWNY